jgi:hypothetical protein
MEKLYRENSTLIKKMSNKISGITGIEREELEAQANLIFCECAQKYDSSRGEFSKYLSSIIYRELYKYAKSEKNITEQSYSEPEEKINSLSSNDNFTIQGIDIKELSEDSQYVYELILSPEIKFVTNSYKKERITKNRIEKFLRNEGWKYPRIKNCFNEISIVLS